ncbi:MAG: hypothetical protein CO108_21465 [Deltaproteobacteria bacterium CG_4_9_14_3_um_filter_63_12]|nr:MAG: hypothetical protein CO108_21465 [Deltaproteobacteria bacterium CG_4_9_14_3_um_filter_63_12]
MNAQRLLFLTLLIVALTPALAWSEPCENLPPADAEKYVALNTAAIEAYGASDFETTIAKTLEALALCAEDNNVKYNLARAYHQNGDCPMALYNYDNLDISGFDRKRKKNIDGYKEELLGVCADSLVVRLECGTPGTMMVFGSRKSVCPWVGRLYPDSLEINLSLDGYRSQTTMIAVAAGGENVFTMPELVSESQFGVLSVTCGEGIKGFEMVKPDGEAESYECPWEGELAIGSYTLKTDPAGQAHVTTVIGQQITNVEALSTPPPSSCACAMREPRREAPFALMAGLLGLLLIARRTWG